MSWMDDKQGHDWPDGAYAARLEAQCELSAINGDESWLQNWDEFSAAHIDADKLAAIRNDARETCAELSAICDEPTQPGIVEAYRPRNNPTNDNEITRVDIPAIGGER